MEILIRKVENNRETNKRVEGRQNEWKARERARDCVGVGAWHLGKTNKIYILLKSFWMPACCHLHALLLHSLFLLCLVPFVPWYCARTRVHVHVFFLAVCLVYSLCVSVPYLVSCSSGGSLYNFIFNTKFCFITPRTGRTGLCNLQAK